MRHVLITGANRGIGFELARQYMNDGDRVFAACRSPDEASDLQAMARGSGGRLTPLAMDVSDPLSIQAAAKEVGTLPLDILVNNAGTSHGPRTLEENDIDGWIYTLKVNAIGPFLVAQALLGNLRRAEQAKIMTVSSRGGSSIAPYGGAYAYGSSKAAVNRIMQAMARDLKADGIVVALVHPGFVRTGMGSPAALKFMEQQGAAHTLIILTAEECASGIRSVIDGMTLEDTGKFYKWNGEIHPW